MTQSDNDLLYLQRTNIFEYHAKHDFETIKNHPAREFSSQNMRLRSFDEIYFLVWFHVPQMIQSFLLNFKFGRAHAHRHDIDYYSAILLAIFFFFWKDHERYTSFRPLAKTINFEFIHFFYLFYFIFLPLIRNAESE